MHMGSLTFGLVSEGKKLKKNNFKNKWGGIDTFPLWFSLSPRGGASIPKGFSLLSSPPPHRGDPYHGIFQTLRKFRVFATDFPGQARERRMCPYLIRFFISPLHEQLCLAAAAALVVIL